MPEVITPLGAGSDDPTRLTSSHLSWSLPESLRSRKWLLHSTELFLISCSPVNLLVTGAGVVTPGISKMPELITPLILPCLMQG
ncbi:hypothetical protein PGTUg99_000579 [Puccinia graminis f. sp. tritici]|uniref:Uncharacterized protein n=1 Tax=Puccinia graminis f. sp. tritici TaxID=56615 RepID=A0A5B0ML86_PUCGR|nr:hypothetical protein PGTUg99_000579 [Puccinia graminis f. sp. tritici]